MGSRPISSYFGEAMIDARRVWLPQIIRYARLISDGETLRKAWLHCDTSQTSVTSYDELIEQIFDDLASLEVIEKSKRTLCEDPELYRLLGSFISEMDRFDTDRSRCGSPSKPEEILQSDRWRAIMDLSARVVQHAKGKGLEGDH